MTFEEWQDTRAVTEDFGWALDAFGNIDDDTSDWQYVVEYDPGVIVRLKNGQYYTHVVRDEYTGDLETVERHLWEDFASHEVY
jgi:hypothetical protein